MLLMDRLRAHQHANLLTDGSAAVTYADLPHEFARLDKLWRNSLDGGQGGPVVLVGRNSLGTAIAGLHLLSTGRACYFWRPPVPLAGSVLPWSDLPEFCSAAVMARPAGASQIDYELALRTPGPSAIRSPQLPYVYVGTSGTTAHPKLAAYTPERLLGNAENCVRRLQISRADRVLLPLPVAHMYGLGAALLPAVLAGASLCLLPVVNVLTYLQAEQTFDPTVVFLTPGLAHQLLAARKHPRRYRLSVLGADRIDAETVARYEDRHGCTVRLYGSTELGAVAACRPDDSCSRRQHTCGALLDDVRLVPKPNGTRGDSGSDAVPLCFVHPFAMSGYATMTGEPELPADVFQEGVYLTRDLGRIDDNGDLHVHGRRDDCVKRDGYLVAFADVERALEQLPGISRSIVCGGKARPRGVELIAFCVARTEASLDPAEIRRQCPAVLPDYSIPDRIVCVEQIPLNATGKPDRQALSSLLGPDE